MIAGRYRLEERLGLGGMSEVWAGTDTELERRVALKLLSPNADNARFEREARAVASLGHPNITQLYDYGEENGRPFMVLEYLPGGTLEEHLRSGKPLPDDDVRRIAAEIAAGLAHAHARGVGASRSEARQCPVRPGGPGEARRLRHRADGRRRGHVHRGRDRARNGRLHLAGAGGGLTGQRRERRLLVRRDALPDAHGAAPVRVERSDGARDPAPRLLASAGDASSAATRLHCSSRRQPRRWRRTRPIALRTEPHCSPRSARRPASRRSRPPSSPPGDDTHATRVLPVAAAALPAAPDAFGPPIGPPPGATASCCS